MQLQDGMASVVHLDEQDRKPLEELMVELIIQHR